MGLDGGTIVTRTDHLRRASWRLATSDGGAHRSTRGGQLGSVEATSAGHVERRDAQQEAADAFATCALSGTALPARPSPGEVVGCGLGRLYLRDSVVLFLAKAERFSAEATDVAALSAAFGHIRSLRDVYGLTLAPNPRRADPVHECAMGQHAEPPGAWLCLVDESVSTTGAHPFGALRPCGHVLRLSVARELSRQRGASAAAAERAPGGSEGKARARSDGVSSLQGGAWECPVCAAPVELLVRLFPPADEAAKCRAALLAQHASREAQRELKRKRKRGLAAGAAGAAGPASGAAGASASGSSTAS